jgi:hypothetical protein
MASSFSEDECVRLFTLSLPESFQFFSVVACAIGSCYSTVAPRKRFRLRCLTWVNLVVLTVRRSLPVYPNKQTSSEQVRTSLRAISGRKPGRGQASKSTLAWQSDLSYCHERFACHGA